MGLLGSEYDGYPSTTSTTTYCGYCVSITWIAWIAWIAWIPCIPCLHFLRNITLASCVTLGLLPSHPSPPFPKGPYQHWKGQISIKTSNGSLVRTHRNTSSLLARMDLFSHTRIWPPSLGFWQSVTVLLLLSVAYVGVSLSVPFSLTH